MPYFVVYAKDKPDGAEIRAQHRAAHRARLRDPDGMPIKVHIGGPLMNDRDQMAGSMLVIEAADKALVETFVQGDPYSKAGLYASITIDPFNWGLGLPQEVSDG